MYQSNRKLLGTECLIFAIVTISCSLFVLISLFEQFKSMSSFRNTILLILAYSVLLGTYTISLFKWDSDTQAWRDFEKVVIGVEQFLILLIIWRTFFWQYWTAAYNIQKFTDFMRNTRME